MVHRPTLHSLTFVAIAVAGACGGGSNVSNASPRVSEVPLQSTTGASAFSLDLASYVTDREGATLTYAVTSGDGAFAGSVYTRTFDTMGEYTVGFTVTDGAKTTTGSFDVRVTAANFVVVREDQSGLLLLDSRTNRFVRVTGAAANPSLAAGLADGRLVFTQTSAGGTDLFVHDPLTRTSTELGAGEDGTVVYRGRTSDGRVLFTAGDSSESTLSIFNPRTGLVLPFAIGQLPQVAVTTGDLVFYQAAVGGQGDVYLYDPADDETQSVAVDERAETIAAALPDGGVVITRVGAGGETDLFHFKRDVGLVEIGADVAAIATMDKSYRAHSSDNKVVFTAASGAVSDLYSWDPATGQTTSLSAAFGAGAFDVFAAVGAGNEVVWNRVVSTTEADAFFFDLDSGVSGTVRNGNDVSQVLGVSGDGTTNWAFVRASATTTDLLAVSLIAAPATQTWAAGGAVDDDLGVVANGDVVGQRADATAIALFDASAGTWGAAITGTGLAFGGDGLDDGDFVYRLTVNAQADLSMWDASAAQTVVVSDVVGDDTFQALTADATLLFTREADGNTNADLFVWDGATVSRLTDVDGANVRHDHTVLGTYAGSR